jgi:lysozyme
VETIRGVDVSEFQPTFNWHQAAQEGIAFGVCKLVEGTGRVDRTFDYHWRSMKEAGVVRFCYGFSRWDLGTDPAAEARFFLEHLPPLQPGEGAALDLEDSPIGVPARPLSSWALAWLAVVEHELGIKPLLYSGAYFASQWLTDPRLAPYGKWVAAYASEPPAMAGPWHPYCMWQHTSGANVAGHVVDESIFWGSVEQLRAYGKPAPHPAPQPQPHPYGRLLITRSMMAREKPSRSAVREPVQWVNRGAVLARLGPQTAHWALVEAGGKPTWVYLPNTKPC